MQNRILIVGSAKPTTGFGRVIRSLADSLGDTYDIHVLGYDVFEAMQTERWTLHPGKKVDVFGLGQLGALHDCLRADLTLFVNDYWFVNAFLASLKRCRYRGKRAAYVPVDARLLDVRVLDPLQELDGLAVYTDFARRILFDSYRAEGKEVPAILSHIHVIPHGTSTEMFHPLLSWDASSIAEINRRKARKALLGTEQGVDGFWVLNANKNSLRKRLDRTMAGFALFAHNKPPDVRLYIHAGRQDTGYDLQRLARNLNLGERLITSADTYLHPEVAAEKLNLIFNACDVGINTAVGEGWGLVAFEHAATGAAQVVPRHSAFAELWSDAAVFMEPEAPIRFGGFLEGHEVSPTEVAAALEKLYTDQNYLARMSQAAYTNATRPEWSWTRVALQWDHFFRTLLAE